MGLVKRASRFLAPIVLLAAGLVACGSGAAPSTETLPSSEILAEADQVALAYQVEGGIAGENFLQVELLGNGTGTVRVGEGASQHALVARSLLAAAIAELEQLGFHDVDPTNQPDTRLGDGTTVHLTVHSRNGTTEVAWYGIGEVPDLFDPDWVAMANRASALAVPLAAPASADDGVAGNPIRGALFEEGGRARVCGALLESFPPQCGEPSTTLINLDVDIVEFESAGGVRWTEDLWTVYGRVTEAGLDLS